MSKKRRFIGVFLAIVMVFAMIPMMGEGVYGKSTEAKIFNMYILSNSQSAAISPSFNPDTTIYSCTLPSGRNSVGTRFELSPGATAVITLDGNVIAKGTEYPIAPGETKRLNIKVTAEDGVATKNYIVDITRSGSSSAKIENMSVLSGTRTMATSPRFNSDITDYTCTLPTNLGTVGVKFDLAQGARAVITLDGGIIEKGSEYPIAPGETKILQIKVRAEDDVTNRTYTVRVTRALSSDANLYNMSITSFSQSMALSPNFDKSIVNYTCNLSRKHDQIGVNFTPAPGAKAVITLDGKVIEKGREYPISVGPHTMKISVTAADGVTKKTYTANITREGSRDADLYNMGIISYSQTMAISPKFDRSMVNYTCNLANHRKEVGTNFTPGPGATAVITLDGKVIEKGIEYRISPGSHTLKITVTAENGVAKKTYTTTINRAKSKNADLSNLGISHTGGNIIILTPSFHKDIVMYDSLVEYEKGEITTTFTPSDTDAKVEATLNGSPVLNGGNYPIKVGPNTLSVKVTAPDNRTIKTYTALITRKPSSNANLKEFRTNFGERYVLSPSFSQDITQYTGTGHFDEDWIWIQTTTADSNATMEVKLNGAVIDILGFNAIRDINVGDNRVEVEVTAQDGVTKKLYTAIITRAEKQDVTLKSLAILSNGTERPFSRPFKSEEDSYNCFVGHDTEKITIKSIANHPTATQKITLDGDEVVPETESGIKVGSNLLKVAVTSQDGATTKTYTVNIIRGPEATSSDADLEEIFMDSGSIPVGYHPEFNKDVTQYETTVNRATDRIRVDAPTSDEAATVELTMNGKFVENNRYADVDFGENVLAIKVIASDGITVKTYNVKITRENPAVINADLSDIKITAEDVPQVLSPEFSYHNTDYSCTVAGGVEKIGLDYSVRENGATAQATFNGAPVDKGDAVPIKVGTNKYVVKVTSADGTNTKTYTTTITRKVPPPSGNASLQNLQVTSGGTPLGDTIFSPDNTEYAIDVEFDIQKIGADFDVSQEGAIAEMTLNGKPIIKGTERNLNIGDNTLAVTVTAPDGTTVVTYNTVIRRTLPTPSNNADLRDLALMVNGREEAMYPMFSKDVLEYTYTVENTVDKIGLEYIPEEDDATVQVTLNEKTLPKGEDVRLDEGKNILLITVTSPDGTTTKTYTVEITRESMPAIIAGANGKWAKGTKEDLSFTSGEDFYQFLRVEVDGVEIEKDKDYSVKEGSTVVDLKPAFLETLSVGTHHMAIISERGPAETHFTILEAKKDPVVEKPVSDKPGENISAIQDSAKSGAKGKISKSSGSPKTGDGSLIGLMMILMLAGASGCIGMTRRNN